MKLPTLKLTSLLKRRPKTWIAAVIVLLGCVSAALLWSAPNQADVLTVANSVSGGGYALKGCGVPEAVVFKGVTIQAKSTPDSHCCGFIFWVAFKVAQQRGLLADKEPYQVKQFECESWGDSKASAEHEIVMAMEDLGIGKAVDPNDALPGDFVTFQRINVTAHSVIFLNYVRDHGVIVGVHYRSSQPITNGVADRTEYFSSSGYLGGKIDAKRFYVCRLNRG